MPSCGWARIPVAGKAISIEAEKKTQVEACIENENAPEVGIRRERLAALWLCDCGKLIVTSHLLETVKANITHGSREKQLRDGGYKCECGRKNQRLNSAKSTKIIAVVPTDRPKSVRNLKYIAEALNAENEQAPQGEFPPIEHRVNSLWFASVRGVKQGKGKKFWCMPIRRWRAMLRGEF